MIRLFGCNYSSYLFHLIAITSVQSLHRIVLLIFDVLVLDPIDADWAQCVKAEVARRLRR